MHLTTCMRAYVLTCGSLLLKMPTMSNMTNSHIALMASQVISSRASCCCKPDMASCAPKFHGRWQWVPRRKPHQGMDNREDKALCCLSSWHGTFHLTMPTAKHKRPITGLGLQVGKVDARDCAIESMHMTCRNESSLDENNGILLWLLQKH
jgi:hypothetical protein